MFQNLFLKFRIPKKTSRINTVLEKIESATSKIFPGSNLQHEYFPWIFQNFQDHILTPLIWKGGGGVILPPCWFSFNNSETVKAVTLAFCSIQ